MVIASMRPRSNSASFLLSPAARKETKNSAQADYTATPTNNPSSLFQISRMPHDKICRRTLHPFSVHYSLSSASWIGTITRHTDDPINKTRFSQFHLSTEREAQKFVRAYSPPKMQPPSSDCFICNLDYSPKRRPQQCRNCGVCVCDKCSTRWGSRMLPKTYVVPGAYPSHTVRVCKSCDWLSNALCLSMLQGRYDDAKAIFDTGNVNLRTCFADIHREAMFPVHCSVLGGSLELVKWLVDTQLCPVSVKQDPKTRQMLSVKTSSNRTLIDLAMTGKPKIDILMFLIHKGLSVTDLLDPSLAPKTLEALLKVGLKPTGLDIGRSVLDVVLAEPSEGSRSICTIDNACNLCCEKVMDCVLSPCGHQMCCSDCGKQLSQCPMCKSPCSVLRIINC